MPAAPEDDNCFEILTSNSVELSDPINGMYVCPINICNKNNRTNKTAIVSVIVSDQFLIIFNKLISFLFKKRASKETLF